MWAVLIQSDYIFVGYNRGILLCSLDSNVLITQSESKTMNNVSFLVTSLCVCLKLARGYLYSGHEDSIIRVWQPETLEMLELNRGKHFSVQCDC